MNRLQLSLVLSSLLTGLLAGCPIAADNYGVDAGDAGSSGDSGVVVVTDAGAASGSITCTISAEDDLGNTANATGAWTGADLSDSFSNTSDGTTYDVVIAGSNSASGTLSLEFDGLTVGGSGELSTAMLGPESFGAGANLLVQDSWSCGPDCGINVNISSFDGQTVTGTFTVQFLQGASSSESSECSLNSGTFNVYIPN
jgi:hypothetical protein